MSVSIVNGFAASVSPQEWLDAQTDNVCLSLLEWLEQDNGCQICVWLQAPLPDYYTLCRPAYTAPQGGTDILNYNK